MTVAYLASDESAVRAGRLMFSLGVPAIGLVCLVIGLVERSRRRRRTPAYPPPQYPPGYAYPPPPGYPVPPYPAHLGYAPGHPPRPRTPKSATALITIGAVLLALGILGNAVRVLPERGRATRTADPSSPSTAAAGPQIGQCFSEFDVGMGSFDRPTDCADPVATYELAAKGGPTTMCPDGKRDDSVYSRLTNESHILCFAPNLQQGHCYLRTDERTTATWTPVDCNESRFARFKVGKRIDGDTDAAQCPPETRANAYPKPPRLYCLAIVDS